MYIRGASYSRDIEGSYGPVLYPTHVANRNCFRYPTLTLMVRNRSLGGCHRRYTTRCYLAVSGTTKGPRALNLRELSLADRCLLSSTSTRTKQPRTVCKQKHSNGPAMFHEQRHLGCDLRRPQSFTSNSLFSTNTR